jgi:aminodeoxyfutalosine deaminase
MSHPEAAPSGAHTGPRPAAPSSPGPGPGRGLSDDELVALPKADLHVHLVGSAAPHTVAALARRHPEHGVPADVDDLREFFAFRDFPHFLRVYTAVSALVRTPDDIVALVLGLAGDMRNQGTGYAEVTVTPVAHLRAGIPPDELAQALDTGAALARTRTGTELAWVYDISGNDGPDGGPLALDAALRHPPAALVGFGLGGPEAGAHRAGFRAEFAAARAAGLHSVPHAGESVGPDEIWAAIDLLAAERIGHGVSAVADPRLLARLRDDRITLEVCPSSNVATGVVATLAAHPLPRLLAAGVPVVLGSDDPPMFGTTLLDEYRLARDGFGLTGEQIRALARASIDASFAPGPVRRRLLAPAGAAPGGG